MRKQSHRLAALHNWPVCSFDKYCNSIIFPQNWNFSSLQPSYLTAQSVLSDLDRNLEDMFPCHNENLSMQYTEIFSALKTENFMRKILIFFLFLLKT